MYGAPAGQGGCGGVPGLGWELDGLVPTYLPLYQALCVIAGLQAQTVLVNDTVSGFIGTDVVLHCSFTNPLPNVKITQVTWQKATNGSKQNVAIYNPAMGVSILSPYKGRVKFLNPSFQDGTIQLFRLQLDDEGVYICEFATFPTGNRESQLNLTVLGMAWTGCRALVTTLDPLPSEPMGCGDPGFKSHPSSCFSAVQPLKGALLLVGLGMPGFSHPCMAVPWHESLPLSKLWLSNL